VQIIHFHASSGFLDENVIDICKKGEYPKIGKNNKGD
jgi:hypothetical protein